MPPRAAFFLAKTATSTFINVKGFLSTDSATSRSLDFDLFLKILLRFRAFDLHSLYFYFLKTHNQEIFRK